MNRNKGMSPLNSMRIKLVYLILFGVFNLLVFTIFKQHSAVFWLSYVFMTLAFAVQIGSMFLSFKNLEVETVFFGIPLASLSVYYFLSELAVGAIFMIFQQVSFTLALVIQVLILAAFLIVAIISFTARDTVQQISDNVRENVANLRAILIDIEMLKERCEDPQLKEKLRKLSETVKYSDPMSNDLVKDVEHNILEKVHELRIYLEENQIEEASNACRELELLYMERNKKLAISK